MAVGIAVGVVAGGALSAGMAHHSGGNAAQAGLLGAALGGIGGAVGGALAGPIGGTLGGGASGAAEGIAGGAIGAAGYAPVGYAMVTPAAGLTAGISASGTAIAAGSSLASAFLEPALAGFGEASLPLAYGTGDAALNNLAATSSGVYTIPRLTADQIANMPATSVGNIAASANYPIAQNAVGSGLGAVAEGTAEAGVPWGTVAKEAVGPALQLGGDIYSAVTRPDMPGFPQPIAPPLIKETDPTQIKKFEESPSAIQERTGRERRADEMFARARAMESLRRTSQTGEARAAGGQTYDEFFQRPRTAQERFIGASPTIGAARH